VVRSVSAPAIVVLAAAALSGCVSTQTSNARLLLRNERTLASQSSVRVTRSNPDVAVTAVTLIRSGRGTAVVVGLRNLERHPLSDLPIAVGVRERGGREQYLNGGANRPYFDTHVASLASSAAAIWVLTVSSRVARARPFARVGFATLPASTAALTLPRIAAVAVDSARALHVALVNRSGVPQYGLQVYAAATRGGHYVAAGRASLAALAGGARAELRLALVGAPSGAQLQLFAPATIFN
jgi:hypothetical protein